MPTNQEYADYYAEYYAPPVEEEVPVVKSTATGLTARQQAALYFARRRRLANQVLSRLTPWMESLTVTEGEYVQNNGFAYQALNTGTTGATPPTFSHGQGSDGEGGILWQFVDPALFSRFIFNAPPTPSI
jgi:hypothetical protein